jgi:hypothetical protein
MAVIGLSFLGVLIPIGFKSEVEEPGTKKGGRW